MLENDPRYEVCLPLIWQPWQCTDLVRLGAANDGGYLVSYDDVMQTNKIVSYGIGDNWDFEQDFVALNDCEIDAYDGQIPQGSLDLVSQWFTGRRKITHKNIVRAGIDGGATVHETIDSPGIFLKCDIEEHEMRIFNDILSVAHRLTGMVIEVHRINLWENYNLVTNFISKMPLKLLHIHANNWGYMISSTQATPCHFELTFGRGLNATINPDLTLPHVLDTPNNPLDHEFKMRFDHTFLDL